MPKLFSKLPPSEELGSINFGKYFKLLKKPAATLLAVFIFLQPLALALAQETVPETTTPTIIDNPTSSPDTSPIVNTPITDILPPTDILSSPTDSTDAPNPNNSTDIPLLITPEVVTPEEIASPLPETVAPTEEGAPADAKPVEEKSPDSVQQSVADSGVYNNSVTPKNSEVSQRLARTDERSGAAVTDYPIVVPPGRNGTQPNLALSYNSQNTEDGSVFGFGWSINIAYIERLNKTGIDQLYSTTTPVYFASSLDGELATTSATSTYVSRVDNDDFRSYTFSNNQWLVEDKNGTQYKFGYASSTQQADPDNASRIYKWVLEEAKDANGNYITYTYYKDAGQIYPDQITYTHTATSTGIFKVEFLRQSRADSFPSFKSGFAVKSNYRINEIKTYVNNSVARDYVLAYTTGNNDVRSLLQSVQESGYGDGTTTPTTLPATTFTYQTTNVGYTSNSAWAMPTGNSNLSFDFGDQLADVNGDGYADYLSAWQISGINSGSYNKVFLRKPDGGWATSTTHVIPGIFNYNWIPMIGLMADVNGDGLVDFVASQDNAANWGVVISDEVYLNSSAHALRL